MLKSSTNCDRQNEFDGVTTFCSAFGPEVYSEPFEATEGEAVAFDWAARIIDDDYEVYAFTVTADNGVGETLEFAFSGEVLAETAGDAASGAEPGARSETAAGGLLPATGADLSALLLALAVGLVVLGSALAGRRRSSGLSSS